MPLPPAFDLVFKISPTPTLVLSPDLHQFIITAINDEFLKLTGWAEKEVMGKDFLSISETAEGKSASHLAEIQLSLEQVLSTGAAHSIPAVKYNLGDEQNPEVPERYFKLQHVPVKNDRHKVINILQSLQDVTEQVKSQKIVKENEKSYWQLLQNLPISAYLCDPEGAILFYNKAAASCGVRSPQSEKTCGAARGK